MDKELLQQIKDIPSFSEVEDGTEVTFVKHEDNKVCYVTSLKTDYENAIEHFKYIARGHTHEMETCDYSTLEDVQFDSKREYIEYYANISIETKGFDNFCNIAYYTSIEISVYDRNTETQINNFKTITHDFNSDLY